MTTYKIDKEIKKHFEEFPAELIINTLFEMNRYFDHELKLHFQNYKKKHSIILDSFKRKMLRNYYYYGNEEILTKISVLEFPQMRYTKKQLLEIESKTKERLASNKSNKIISSIKTKLNDINRFKTEKQRSEIWLNEYINSKEPSLIIFNINQNMIDNFPADYEGKLYQIINYIYDKLQNYRYVAVVIKEKIVLDDLEISWDILAKISVYMENFKDFEGVFRPFNKNKKIEELVSFLTNNNNLRKGNYSKLASKFYDKISTGFIFSDLLISNNQTKKILIMRKIMLDERPIKCPSCLKQTGRGNSYPTIFQKSWECQNPNCIERSKSGRGKRYDEYGTFRYFKLVENNQYNTVNRELYKKWRRDIFANNLDIFEMLIMYYTWNNEKVLIINDYYQTNLKTRRIEFVSPSNITKNNFIRFEELRIYKLLLGVNKYSRKANKVTDLTEKENIINGDSTKKIQNIKSGLVGCAITSPPYYNAREYSQWPNFMAYLIDMMLNAKSVYNSLDNDGVYLYNVGDIVDNDNIYVSSNMSKRRIMLGFYSVLIFKIVGYKFISNIIWDKGEVESKRNSTVNLFSGYIKYVNCYEHILVFKKNDKQLREELTVKKIKPVYKINCKGENSLGHTAPYPEELVELIKPYIINEKYVLDPFLGSGTTGIWCKKNNLKFIGYEINKEYYNLAVDRISSL